MATFSYIETSGIKSLVSAAVSETVLVRPPPRSFQPFSEEIQNTPVPQRFREPVIDAYNGTGDPQNHVAAFQTQMFISGGDGAVSCKMFAGTLKEVALKWFTGLPSWSVTSFDDLDTGFVAQFSANKKKWIEVSELFDILQGASEPLKSFLSRFNKISVLVEEPDEKFFVAAFIKGFQPSNFSEALLLKKPSSMDEIRLRVEKHIEAKESTAGKKATDNKETKQNFRKNDARPPPLKNNDRRGRFSPQTDETARWRTSLH